MGRGLWLLALLVLIWNLLALLPRGQAEATIPYTTFLEEVRAGNVDSVRVTNSQISGRFVHPFPWPPPTKSTAPAAKPSAGAPPSPVAYTSFVTDFPQALGDPTLMSLLVAKGVQVTAAPPPNPLLGLLLTSALPALLFVGVFFWMRRQAAQGQGGALNFGGIKPRRATGERPGVTFADVAGEGEAKADLVEVVDFLRHPRKWVADYFSSSGDDTCDAPETGSA